jgi:hypothetical protein
MTIEKPDDYLSATDAIAAVKSDYLGSGIGQIDITAEAMFVGLEALAVRVDQLKGSANSLDDIVGNL